MLVALPSLSELNQLKDFKAKGNRVMDAWLTIAGLQEIVVDMSENKLQGVPVTSPNHFVGLKELILSFNNIASISKLLKEPFAAMV